MTDWDRWSVTPPIKLLVSAFAALAVMDEYVPKDPHTQAGAVAENLMFAVVEWWQSLDPAEQAAILDECDEKAQGPWVRDNLRMTLRSLDGV